MAEDQSQLLDVLTEFNATIDTLVGLYQDSLRGFHMIVEWSEGERRRAIETAKGKGFNITAEQTKKGKFYYSEGPPTSQDSMVLHPCTYGELEERNREGGRNQRAIGNVVLVNLYHYWEEHYRTQIADCINVNRRDVSSDIIGDIRLVRNSVIHHLGIAKREITRCKILKWFNEDDEILITQDHLVVIVAELRAYLNKLAKEHIGHDPGFGTMRTPWGHRVL